MAVYDPINLNEHINLNITHLAQKVLDSDRLLLGTAQEKGFVIWHDCKYDYFFL